MHHQKLTNCKTFVFVDTFVVGSVCYTSKCLFALAGAWFPLIQLLFLGLWNVWEVAHWNPVIVYIGWNDTHRPLAEHSVKLSFDWIHFTGFHILKWSTSKQSFHDGKTPHTVDECCCVCSWLACIIIN